MFKCAPIIPSYCLNALKDSFDEQTKTTNLSLDLVVDEKC